MAQGYWQAVALVEPQHFLEVLELQAGIAQIGCIRIGEVGEDPINLDVAAM